ncbi:CoA transferase [Amycolatopsis bartoniae]|nr:CoA transferase [Amycolatopsis bartoniae]TVT06368.1 carnitine dehydratase [Amycolatopsis bartoniae]
MTGPESVLPGPFRVTEAAAQSVAAATLAAAELVRLKGIDPGEVSVDRRHAAAVFRSERYVRVDGEPPAALWEPLSGDYRAADGWVRLHCNYPHHAEAACRALGTRDLAAAVATRTAWDVQEAVVAAGGAAAAMRRPDEWLASPQGQAVAAAPLVEWDFLGAAPVRELSTSDRPLGGVRVLELTHVIAGPAAGRVLAAHGAEVLHISAAHQPVLRPLVVDLGMGKRSAHVDLRTAEGRDTLWRLVSEADVFLQSYRPDALARLGFSAERLARARPGIVVAELDAYGWRGPWAGRRGFDSLVQMASGIAAGEEPRPLPAQALDHGTGWLTAAAIMTALRRGATEGGSRRVRLSLARTGHWLDSLGREEGAVDELDPSDLLVETDSPWGRITHVLMPGAPLGMAGSRLPGMDRPDWN